MIPLNYTNAIPGTALFVAATVLADAANAVPPQVPDVIAERRTADLPDMLNRGIVRALVTPSRTGFFSFEGKPRGMQAEMLQQFEAYLNEGRSKRKQKIHVVFVPVPFSEMLDALEAGEGDIAAHPLTVTPKREERVAFAQVGWVKVNELVVSFKFALQPAALEDLSGRPVFVLRGSSYAEHLWELSQRLHANGLRPIRVQEADPNLATEDILELVNAGIVHMTVSDDYKARLWAEVLPNLVVREDLRVHEGGRIGWAVRKNNPALLLTLNKFGRRVNEGSLLGNVLFKRYYEHTRWIKNPLADAERRKLEKFLVLFRKYGLRYGFDYIALLAQAYQESGLDHGKKSHRGAVGVMQLLPSTAADPNVGIKNIRDPEKNVHAATKYLAFLRDRYYSGPQFREEDRLAFTWAAYNAGPAKVRRMRMRAERMGLNPDRWFHHVSVAAQRIVGSETTQYVANIYKYYVAYSLMRDLLDEKAAMLEAMANTQ